MWWQNIAKCCKIEMKMHLLQTENQMKLCQANKVAADKIKELNKLKRDIVLQ